MKPLTTILIILLLIPLTMAEEKYSFEKSEKLKPLIKWRDYSPKSFNEAAKENKPIFLLLTAPSWCYWCQVYESEEYLFHPTIVSFINDNFIPIYVDADQRQDLTRQYLEGGWPSTTILTPSGERLYGYSGPRPVDNMLANMQQAITSVQAQGFQDTQSLEYTKTENQILTKEQLDSLLNNYVNTILYSHDKTFGGFGSGQKFPQGRSMDFSLDIYELTKNEEYKKLVETTLNGQYTKISELETNYNLFDPVEGGFHRYGTKIDYTPPHYEKMLYDNVLLLRAYFHLQQLDKNNEINNEVVSKTHYYIKENYYDSNKGGFYGNTDVHGEDNYYGKNPRPLPKPRIEKTKYTDWNSEAIITYLYLYDKTKSDEYKIFAESTLNFYIKNIDKKHGAYHFIMPEGIKEVRGSLLDNSYLTLAFIEGYETLNEEKYLESATLLADYSLDNLYDWNSGGFFERNSPDKNLYAPGDNVNLNKPEEENSIISYAMLKLYTLTKDPKYLNAAIKSLSATHKYSGSLDRGYYYGKSAQYILKNNLLEDYNSLQSEIQTLEVEKQNNFWLSNLLSERSSITGFAVSDEGIDKIKGPLFLLLIVAFIAGVISFASPCTLPILPAFLAFSLKSEKHNIKAMTISFFLGLVAIFAILGMSASFLGLFLKSHITIFSQIAGIAIMFFGFFILLGKTLKGFNFKTKKPSSYFTSFIFGAILGLSWTPCVGPILVAILLLASTTTSFLTGGLLLTFYGIGLSLPLIFVSSYLGKINKEEKIWKLIKGKEIIIQLENKTLPIHTNNILAGLIFIILGYLIFSGILFSFNQYVSSSGFQQFIFNIEDKILGWVR